MVLVIYLALVFFRCAYLIVLKITKLMLTVIGMSALANFSGAATEEILILQQASHVVPHQSSDCMVRQVAQRIIHNLRSNIQNCQSAHRWAAFRPDLSTIRSVMFLAWSAATGNEKALNEPLEKLHDLVRASSPSNSSVVYEMCREALETLTVMLMLSPGHLSSIISDKNWPIFVADVLLICAER